MTTALPSGTVKSFCKPSQCTMSVKILGENTRTVYTYVKNLSNMSLSSAEKKK
jgi:hypothetical protein